MHSRFQHNMKPLAFAVFTAIASSTLPATSVAQTPVAAIRHYDIPAGSLDLALSNFAVQAGLRFHLDSSLSFGLNTPGLQGAFTPEQGLRELLKNTGLAISKQSDGSYRLYRPGADVVALPEVNVVAGRNSETGAERDMTGQDDVYDKNVSTVYISREEVERFKGSSPADIIKGASNVYAGNLRNGGGLDPNIRGVQGPGRVPVIIDGTEQAVTVWNGYRGASNRSYIDPNLISNTQVLKGPTLTPNVNSGIGGAVVVQTLTASDIVKPGENFGAEFLIEGSNNAVKPQKPTLHTGKDAGDVPEYANRSGGYFDDPAIERQMHTKSRQNPLAGDDFAYRIALAGHLDRFEWLGAYAYRKRGNYFSGKKGAGFYSEPRPADLPIHAIKPEHMAVTHRPGDEVPNTSSEMKSVLLKGTYSFSDFNKLQLNLRHTDSTFGEIMASRANIRTENGVPQWPLSKVRTTALGLKHHWNPDSAFIDMKSNLWATFTRSKTNTAGGRPNDHNGPGTIVKNTAAVDAKEYRLGFDISNKMQLLDNLDLAVASNYQFQKLKPTDGLPKTASFQGGAGQRAGQRQAFNASFNFSWRPVSPLELNAGARYDYYRVQDDFLKNRIKHGDTQHTRQNASRGIFVRYQTLYTQADADSEIARRTALYRSPTPPPGFPPFLNWDLVRQANIDSITRNENAKVGTPQLSENKLWLRDSKGRLRRSTNPCQEAARLPGFVQGSCRSGGAAGEYEINRTAAIQKGDGWAPSFSATYELTDRSRIYYRHTQALRFPSLFESTSGFSASSNPYTRLKPEHAFNHEVGYVYMFDNADIKLAYFDNTTKNVIDRKGLDGFFNLEKQHVRGLEFSGRYDNGLLFSSLGLTYNLKNEICDENTAITLDINGGIPDCVKGAFPTANDGTNDSYLAFRVLPKYSANWLVGHRLLNQKLETGIRTIHTAGSRDGEPVKRDKSTTFDAYVKYQFTDDIKAELVGTNLTNRYYLEPMSSSAIPAPGRTIKISLKASL
ncbi:TonB-dependent receptor [Endozoicomonadaceae bacterium StTr2]